MKEMTNLKSFRKEQEQQMEMKIILTIMSRMRTETNL
jgi:hypothetical protein